MKTTSLFGMAAKMAFVLCLAAMPAWAEERGATGGGTRTAEAGPFAMRGFGTVSATAQSREVAGGRVSRVVFQTEDAAKARIVASKYLADLLAYGAVSRGQPLPGLQATVIEVRHGGAWLLGLDNTQVRVLNAPNREMLTTLARSQGAANWQAVPEQAYPRWLDNFDNAALGIWWTPGTKTPEQLAWMKDFPAVANLHGQLLTDNPAPGVYDTSGPAHAMAQLNSIGKPYRYMLWASAGQEPVWLNAWTLPGHHIEDRPKAYLGRRFFDAGPYLSHQGMSDTMHAITRNAMVEMMRQHVDDDQVLGWMEPHGEFGVRHLELLPGYQSRFPDWLRTEKGYDLAALGRAWTGNPAAFADWSEVTYKTYDYFKGRRGRFLDLDDIPWRWRPGDREVIGGHGRMSARPGSGPEGEPAGWHKPDFDDSDWAANRRDHFRLLSQWSERHFYPLWYRFTHEVPAEFLAGGRKIYLHIMPRSEHAGGEITVWINGREVARKLRERRSWLTLHVHMDVTEALRPGDNHFAIYSNGGRIAYRVWLSDSPGETFPFADAGLSQRYADQRAFYNWDKLQTLKSYLRLMRAVDPNRPIKVMTPGNFQAEAMELFERYGAYPQLTGQGSQLRYHHYKGYSALRRLPSSSEAGSPPNSAREAQYFFATMFTESQDKHDYVFDMLNVRNSEMITWWNDNKALLSTLGKTDLADFKLGVLSDLRQGYLYGGVGGGLGFSHGSLQALGLTPVLVDGLEFEKGLGHALPVILDSSTAVMAPAMVDSVKRYVAEGGVFVTSVHAGRHTPTQRDAWPLAAAFGLKGDGTRVTGDNYHRWPSAKLRFTAEQTLLPSLRGQEAAGRGISIDWQDKRPRADVALSPLAHWEDGSMAIAEITHGKGRI
ncbi:MAG: hypothetical protein EA424_01690, partial [Planctomycetaceae bacterium]